MNLIKKSLVASMTIITIAGCSNFQSSNTPVDFTFKDGKATHLASEIMGESFTFITPKGASLENHFTLGNRFFSSNEPGERKRIYTYITKTTLDNKFSYTKTKCKRERAKAYLLEGEYFDDQTKCLMKQGYDIPIFGVVTEYETTYSLTKGTNSDTHRIKVVKAQSTHTQVPALLGVGGPQAAEKEQAASRWDFYQLFQRYTDDTLTFKFTNYSPDEIKSAVLRESRRLNKMEKMYVDYVDGLSVGDTLYFSHAITLKDREGKNGIVAYRIAIEPYKNNGSILNITPSYYPSKSEVGTEKNKTINFALKREEILSMIKRIQNN